MTHDSATKTASTFLAVLVGLLVLVSGVIFAVGLSRQPSATPSYSHIPTDEEETIAAAHKALLERLKYPDDAEFLNDDEIRPDDKKPRYYSVHGKVKAANTFGAHLTHRFVVHVRRSEHGKLSVHRVQFDDDLLFDDPWPKP